MRTEIGCEDLRDDPTSRSKARDNTTSKSRQVMIPPSLDHQPPSSCCRRWHNSHSPPKKSKAEREDSIKTGTQSISYMFSSVHKARHGIGHSTELPPKEENIENVDCAKHQKMGDSMHEEPCPPLAPACKGLIGVPASIRQAELLYHP